MLHTTMTLIPMILTSRNNNNKPEKCTFKFGVAELPTQDAFDKHIVFGKHFMLTIDG